MVMRKRLNVALHVRCYILTCTTRLNQMHRLFSVKWEQKLAAHVGVLSGIAFDKEEWSRSRIQRPSEPLLTDVRINTKQPTDIIRNLIFWRLKFMWIIHKIRHLPAENKCQVHYYQPLKAVLGNNRCLLRSYAYIKHQNIYAVWQNAKVS